MPGIIALALIAVVALIVLSFALHVLFSPWLLVILLAHQQKTKTIHLAEAVT